jgi:tetraacyldisaccharide 4'-kinase
MIVGLRNEMFDLKILSSREFDFPIISVGNITVGGTGKTPHTEYIIRLLRNSLKVATLSRGYKRKTRGFYVAQAGSSVKQVGDEPLQMKIKFNDAIVAVDSKRVRGIEKLLGLTEKPQVIILDDAYQHRYVSPGLNILLTDYDRLITKDSLLPYGRLRESAANRSRANMIIVTKCPAELKPIEERIITKELTIRPYQNLYFTRLEYGPVQPVYPDINGTVNRQSNSSALNGLTILMITGIANPTPLKDYLVHQSHIIQHINFSDHHNYTIKDMDLIMSKFEALSKEDRIIITTEKDMVRIRELENVPDLIKQNLYYIPLMISFLNKGGKDFDQKILSYVTENKVNFDLHTRKNQLPS